MENKKVTFVGSGIIGAGLAVNAVMHGWDVWVWYRRNFEKLSDSVKTILKVFSDNGVCTEEEAEGYYHAIHFTMDLEEAVSGAALVQESIAERIEDKREMYQRIQSICGEDTLIASSTSMLFPSALKEGALYPHKIVVGHPYNPAHLLPIMEICGGEDGCEETIQAVKAVYEGWGKVPVICRKEVKGFVVNELNQWATRFAREQVCKGVCSAEDMDKAIMYGPGLRMALLGQILTTSLGVEGGFRNMCAKYNLPPNPEYDTLAEGVDEIFAHRSETEGKTPASAAAYRDKMIIELLKLKGIM